MRRLYSMEAANRTRILCPQYPNASDTIPLFYDPSTFNDPHQLTEIACEAARLSAQRPVFSFYMKQIHGYSSLVGFISTILAFLAYSLKDFKANAFYYYRTISFYDFIYMFIHLKMGFFTIGNPLLSDCYDFICRISGKTGHLLVIWVSIDRCVACQWPHSYKKLDNKRMSFFIILGVLCLALTYEVTLTTYDFRYKYYQIPRPDFPLAVFDRIWRGAEGLLMAICLPIVIRAFVNMTKRKRMLIGENRAGNAANKELLSQIKTNRSLCVLQFCDAIPFILVTVFGYITFLTNFFAYEKDKNPWIANSTYEANLQRQRIVEIQAYFETFCISIADEFCHSCHFFTYFAFSLKFRNAVMRFLRKKFGNAVVQSSSNANS